jgi:hypothetical protein
MMSVKSGSVALSVITRDTCHVAGADFVSFVESAVSHDQLCRERWI